MNPIPKIAVTGTKGKTTVVAVVASVLQRVGCDTLRVDTTGHYVNGEQRSTLDDSKRIWNLVPSVCPGRYLWEFKADETLSVSQQPVAVLECSLGCSGGAGLGYRYHKVGVFLNVMEDHLGSSERLKTQADIAEAKRFIFSRVMPDGYAVFNADDALVVAERNALPVDANITQIACGLTLEAIDVAAHLASGGVVVTRKDTDIVLRTANTEQILCSLTALPWTFHGHFTPSVYNALFAVGALYGYFDGQLPVAFREAFEATRLDLYGGRLTLLTAENGATILADYAHEKVSLGKVAELAKTMTGPRGKVIGVVRLAYDRTPELITETGQFIADKFDAFVVYDKIDGYRVKGEIRTARRFQKEVGKVSQLLTDAIRPINKQVTRILREDEALNYAADRAKPGDVVVVIVNDDIRQSIEFIKTAFQAEFA